MEGGPRRSSSSDVMNAAQVHALAVKGTFQEALTIEICLMSI